MAIQLKRRNFLKTMGKASVSLPFASLLSRCKSSGKKSIERPNILWIEVEDVSPFFSCYGYEINPTPHVDRLAGKGVRFDRTFMPAPVCSPCRSALITGMMQTTLGTHQHHSSRSLEAAIYLPEGFKTIPERFRETGYFTFNFGKDDYNFWYDRENLYTGEYSTHKLYGKSGKEIDWNVREAGQPFFGQIQLRGGKEIYAKDFKEKVRKPLDRAAVGLPPYYPDHPLVREDWAQHYDSIQVTDDRVGKIVDQLRADGLLENTVIFFFSDHGMRLWRHKQFCYDSGLHVPFVVCWEGNPEGLGGAGIVRDDLVNGIDIAATSLALAGIPIPETLESRDLFAEDFKPRDYVISARDRCDYTIDRIRTVRTAQFRYIRNFLTDRPYMQPNYRDQWEITQVMRKLHYEGKLDEIQDRFWSDIRLSEELYDIKNDPHGIHNLAGNPDFASELEKHRKILEKWIKDTDDKGQYPEDDANLKFMLDWWGEKCVNPEYDRVR
jgi:arylsulfatase A-like enzyme